MIKRDRWQRAELLHVRPGTGEVRGSEQVRFCLTASGMLYLAKMNGATPYHQHSPYRVETVSKVKQGVFSLDGSSPAFFVQIAGVRERFPKEPLSTVLRNVRELPDG